MKKLIILAMMMALISGCAGSGDNTANVDDSSEKEVVSETSKEDSKDEESEDVEEDEEDEEDEEKEEKKSSKDKKDKEEDEEEEEVSEAEKETEYEEEVSKVAKKKSDDEQKDTSVAVVKEDKKGGKFDADNVVNNLSTTTYTWSEEYGGHYLALVIKNNSGMDCGLSASVTFKDATGNLIGAKDNAISAFKAGTEVCLLFNNNEAFGDFSYDYEVSELSYYEASDLTQQVTTAKDKAIVSITNNGEKASQVSYTALFFLGGNVVDSDWGYPGEIGAGKTKVEESSVYGVEFDTVKVYVDGYGYDH